LIAAYLNLEVIARFRVLLLDDETLKG